MGTRPNSRSKILLFIGVILIYGSLVAHRPLRYLGAWALDPYDWVHWAGVSGAFLFMVVAVGSWRGLRVRGLWSQAHIPLGLLTLVFAVTHSRTKAGVILPVHYSSIYVLVIMGIVVVSGFALRFLRIDRGVVWWRLVHSGATPALGLVLLHHVLVKLAVI